MIWYCSGRSHGRELGIGNIASNFGRLPSPRLASEEVQHAPPLMKPRSFIQINRHLSQTEQRGLGLFCSYEQGSTAPGK